MADFFKGLSGGFQTGLQLGQALRERREREALAEAYRKPETFQGYTEEQGAQLRAAAESGQYDVVPQYDDAGQFTQYAVTPKASPEMQGLVAPQQVQEYGRTRVAGQFDPTQLRGLQMREAARITGEFGDPVKAAQLMQQAEDMEYQSRMRPMQERTAQLQVEGLERTAASEKRVEDFSQFRAANPDMTVAQLKDAARNQFKLNDSELLKVTANIAGLQENELKIWKNEVTDAIKGKNLNQLVEIFNTDDRFDPNTDLRVTRRDGRVEVAVVDRTTGRPVSTENFESETAAQAYLRRQALEPDTLADWLLQRKEVESQIGLRGAQAQALRDRPAGGRAPTQAEVTARARMYLDNDTTGELTVAGAVALAERDLGGGGGAAPEPTGIDRLVQLMEERREQERANQPGGLR